jgi:hypothetical protein
MLQSGHSCMYEASRGTYGTERKVSDRPPTKIRVFALATFFLGEVSGDRYSNRVRFSVWRVAVETTVRYTC